MRKWIIADEYICAFLSAMGYGFGYSIPYIFGAPGWLCLLICFPCGMLLEKLAIKIIYSRYCQENRTRKLLIFAGIILVFLVGNYASTKIFEESLVGNLLEEFGYVLLFEVAGFAFYMLRHHYRKTIAKERYGSGEEGFRFEAGEKAYIQGLNGTNAKIHGDYDEALAVKTRTGIYVGEKVENVLCFKGIPYAKAPVGALRWKAPEALPDSDEAREAIYFGPSAIQVDYEGNPLRYHKQSEDCLYLNVWTADKAAEEKRAVVVYIHGGDFSYGGSTGPIWNLQNFVKENPDVVAVSFNYRLGLLGFMDFSAVPGGEGYEDAHNLGLLDQIAALEWVKENIAAFGGDAGQITVFGDGSGGDSISLLSVCRRGKGLFKKAIVFSGNPIRAELFDNDNAVSASELLKAANVADMAGLLALPERKLHSLTQKLKAYMTTPQCDGILIPVDVFGAYRKGDAKDIEFVLCASRDNASAYGASIGRGFSEQVISESVEKIFSMQKTDIAEQLKKQVSAETDRIGKTKAEAAFINLYLDRVGMLQLSEALRAGGSSVHMIFWDAEAVIKNLGAGSVNAVTAILDNMESAAAYGSVVNESVVSVVKAFILKVINDEDTALYSNEVDGIGEIKWEPYPCILNVEADGVKLSQVAETLSDALALVSVLGK